MLTDKLKKQSSPNSEKVKSKIKCDSITNADNSENEDEISLDYTSQFDAQDSHSKSVTVCTFKNRPRYIYCIKLLYFTNLSDIHMSILHKSYLISGFSNFRCKTPLPINTIHPWKLMAIIKLKE